MRARLIAWLMRRLERFDWCGGCGDPECDDCASEWEGYPSE